MAKIRFGEGTDILPVLAPVSATTGAVRSAFIDLNLAHWATFLVSFNTFTTGAGATCDDITITVEGSSIASSAGATAIPFTYRLSNAVATAGWGAITDNTGNGATIVSSDLLTAAVLIDVDPANVLALGEAHRWVGVCMVPTTTLAHIASVTAFLEPRYPGNSLPSST